MRRSPYELRSRVKRVENITPSVVSYNSDSDALQLYTERLAVLKAISSITGESADTGCRILDIFGDVVPLEPTSVSNMLLALAKYYPARTAAPLGVAIKFSLVSCDPKMDDSQEIEKLIYQQVIHGLITKSHTPHLLLPLGYMSCGNFQNIIQSAAQNIKPALKYRLYNMAITQLKKDIEKKHRINAKIVRLFDKTKQEDIDTMISQGHQNISEAIDKHNARMHGIVETYIKDDVKCAKNLQILIMERAQGTQLIDILDAHYDKEKNLVLPWLVAGPILFQTLYTLLCFQRVGLMHSDLHAGNVFVDAFPEPQEHTYSMLLGGDIVACTLKSKYFARIFDFDRSFSASIKENVLLDKTILCEYYGQCNEFRYFADAHAILLVFYYFYLQKALDETGTQFFQALAKDAQHITDELFIYTRNIAKFENARPTDKDDDGVWNWGYSQFWCKDSNTGTQCVRKQGEKEDLEIVMRVLSKFFPYTGGNIDYLDPDLENE